MIASETGNYEGAADTPGINGQISQMLWGKAAAMEANQMPGCQTWLLPDCTGHQSSRPGSKKVPGSGI